MPVTLIFMFLFIQIVFVQLRPGVINCVLGSCYFYYFSFFLRATALYKSCHYYHYLAGVNQRSEDVTTQQQRPESPTGTLTCHASKYKVHKMLEMDIPIIIIFVVVVAFSLLLFSGVCFWSL